MLAYENFIIFFYKILSNFLSNYFNFWWTLEKCLFFQKVKYWVKMKEYGLKAIWIIGWKMILFNAYIWISKALMNEMIETTRFKLFTKILFPRNFRKIHSILHQFCLTAFFYWCTESCSVDYDIPIIFEYLNSRRLSAGNWMIKTRP